MPHLIVRNVNFIRYSALRHKLDIQFLVFDKDNTLTLTNGEDFNAIVEKEFFRDLFENYYGRCFLLTNNENNYLREPPFEDLRREFGLPDFDEENGMVFVDLVRKWKEIAIWENEDPNLRFVHNIWNKEKIETLAWLIECNKVIFGKLRIENFQKSESVYIKNADLSIDPFTLQHKARQYPYPKMSLSGNRQKDFSRFFKSRRKNLKISS